MTDDGQTDERIAEFLRWRRCPGEHLLIGTKTCKGWLTASGSHEAYVPELDDSPYGWMALGELVAAIEAKGWGMSTDSYWVPERKYAAWVHGRRGYADNLPEAVKFAVLAALEAEA